MSTFIRKFRILNNVVKGYFIKFKYDIFGIQLGEKGTKKFDDVIVSLTSYGRRVKKDVVYYTLLSILNQTVQPHKIILWLDESWNDENIPKRLKSLKDFNVEINYYKDIKSYKKLIPSLEKYPDKIIITIDDDMIYHPKLIETLMNGYMKNGCIQCTKASLPIKKGKDYISYNNWLPIETQNEDDIILPIGVGGILYPPHALSNEVLKKSDFMRLAPNADDLWFWIMALRQGNKAKFMRLPGENCSFDTLYQFFHKGSALTHSNSILCENDVQLKNILQEYPIPCSND